jgi:hypothetical protein
MNNIDSLSDEELFDIFSSQKTLTCGVGPIDVRTRNYLHFISRK